MANVKRRFKGGKPSQKYPARNRTIQSVVGVVEKAYHGKAHGNGTKQALVKKLVCRQSKVGQ